MKNRIAHAFIITVALAALAGCSGGLEDIAPKKATRELPHKVVATMNAKGMKKTSPVMMRIFKEESVLEVWKQKTNGKYDLIASYDICKWSGELGPKYMEGDRQAPEGFYTVTPAQMNPNSQYHLAFNIGFPNVYDRANGRTGQHLMVHGDCSSSGCYSMTDEQIEEIYAFARDAFAGGQSGFQIQAFPFRMTPQNMARYKNDPNFEFWQTLKVGYDHFEITRQPPRVDVCDRQYQFNRVPAAGHSFSPTQACPPSAMPDMLAMQYSKYKAEQDKQFASAQSVWKRGKSVSRSILGVEEAKLVADWSRRRARGEKVTAQPPSLSSPTAVASAKPSNEPSTSGSASAVSVAANAQAPATESVPTSAYTATTQAGAPMVTSPAIPTADPRRAQAPEDVVATAEQQAPQRRSSLGGLFSRIVGN